jgi:signal transduction histidine kinase
MSWSVSVSVLAQTDPASPPMMESGPSVALFAAATVGVSVLTAAALPPLLRRLPLRRGIPALALVGPVLALVGGLIGAGAMVLSGHDIWYALVVAASTGAASIVVGLRLARPLARDLDRVSNALRSVARGERSVRTGVVCAGEVGTLAGAVDELSRSLARAEIERRAADDERRSVVSALSHDLRTPLASLLVSVEALEDGVGDTATHLRAVRGNVLALEALVGDLFLLARADSGSLELSRELLDLAELVDEAVEAVQPMASLTDVAVVAEAPEVSGPIVVAADHHAVGRVLRNVLDNAIRFSPPGGTVAVINRSDPDRARIQIIDEGSGFPPSFIPHAFERFTQADGARSSPGAAGLGLAIARTLLSAHGGSIAIEPGPGGRVEIELPRLDPDHATSEERLTPRSAVAPSAEQRRPRASNRGRRR